MIEIFEAIKVNNLILLENLLQKKNYDINKIFEYNKWVHESLLHFAVRYNSINSVSLLLTNDLILTLKINKEKHHYVVLL